MVFDISTSIVVLWPRANDVTRSRSYSVRRYAHVLTSKEGV